MMRSLSTVVFLMVVGANAVSGADEGDKLHALFDAEWEWTMRTSPTWASRLGDLRFNDRWEDLRFETLHAQHAHRQELLKKLDAIDVEKLSATDRVSHALLRRDTAAQVREFPYGFWLLPLNQRGGIQTADSLASALRFRRVKDYEDWLARLRAFPASMDQTIALMTEGARRGMVHTKVVMRRVPKQIEKQIVDDPRQSLFYKPFRSFPDSIPPGERKRLVAEAKEAIARGVVPAFRKLHAFFTQVYLPACHERVGAWQMPKGQELYAARAARYTTTGLTPAEIHAIGRREVKRIRGEMQEIVRQVQFAGTFQEFLTYLRTDKRFYYNDANELLEAYRAVSKRVDPQLVGLFRKLPRMPYGVQPIPMNIAPDTTTAYYRPPAADGTRAGTYFVNLYKLESRPKYEIEALSLHEAVPGHHLQIALAMELEGLPAFRRYGGYTAFIEGWGLYSESLGGELGLYQDPYSKFGQLTYEMWRAVRLVVDTGMHSLKWTRQEAIEFFAANTAKTMLDIENEIDRYISWPGQALAYKIGELKIKELRQRSETALGESFDVREFHDVVLSNGAVPLDVLEAQVEAWLKGKGGR